MTGVVIVGGGLGGLRSAESLRASGYAGPISVVGDEPYLPYNRPPLSKEALAGGLDVAELEFRRKPSVDDVVWLVGARVEACDLRTRTLTIDDGSVLPFTGLVAASGLRPRRLPIPGPSSGRHVLRTIEDAKRIRGDLTPGAQVLIMGAGFIGCEVAATARMLGADVSIVALDREPMIAALGAELGAAMRGRHESHGVRFHLGRTIATFTGDDRVEAAVLDDGSEIPASIVIEAVGSVMNLEWLADNSLDLSDGVLVDSGMRVDTDLAPMVAVGDIARHPNGLFGTTARRVEHWNMPTETARRAGRTLAALLAGGAPADEPFTALPSFWSDQYDAKLQSFGMPGLGDRVVVADGDLDGPCIVEYHDATGVVGVVGINRTQDLAPYRKAIMSR